MTTSYDQGGEDSVRMLLDGLGVESLRELHELVTDGKYYRFMLGEGFDLARLENGVRRSPFPSAPRRGT